MTRIDIFTHPVTLVPKQWNLLFQVLRVSRGALNISLITLTNQYLTLITHVKDQMGPDLHGLDIRLNTEKPKFVCNVINMKTITGL